MGYDKISGLRDLFERDTTGLLNSPQRLILIVMVSIEGVDGFFLDFERFCAMTGLKKRALLQNLHYLRDGKSYKNGSYLPCSNYEHRHLAIVSTERYARTGSKQTYRTNLGSYEELIRVHEDALTSSPNGRPRVHSEEVDVHPEAKMSASKSQSGGTPVHPYIQQIQQIQDIQTEESYEVKLRTLLRKKLSNDKRFTVTPDLVRICDNLELKGTSFKAIESELSALGADSIINPKGFVKSRLVALLDRDPDWSSDNKPQWCGSCEEISRQNKYPSEIPGGDGAMTYSCLNCDPFMVSMRNL